MLLKCRRHRLHVLPDRSRVHGGGVSRPERHHSVHHAEDYGAQQDGIIANWSSRCLSHKTVCCAARQGGTARGEVKCNGADGGRGQDGGGVQDPGHASRQGCAHGGREATTTGAIFCFAEHESRSWCRICMPPIVQMKNKDE